MAKKTNELPHPQNALNKFMVRILFEKQKLDRAYNLDGKTISIFKVKPNSGTRQGSDDVGGLVDSHLEDMYHYLYDEALELQKLLINAKAECYKAGADFKIILNPLLDSMFFVHESGIEDLRTGKGWNTEAHSKAFEKLNHELGAYSERINQIAANPADKLVALQPIVKKKKGRDSVSIKINKLILKLEPKKLPDKELALLLSEKIGQNITSDMIRNRKTRLRQKREM